MLLPASVRHVCSSCRRRLSLLRHGFAFRSGISHAAAPPKLHLFRWQQAGSFHVTALQRATVEDSPANVEAFEAEVSPATSEPIEARVRRARQIFGDTLPRDYLQPDEYQHYVRLYGPPLAETAAEDAELLQPVEEESEEDVKNTLFKKAEDGSLEEVEYEVEKVEPEAEEVYDDGQQFEQDQRLEGRPDTTDSDYDDVGPGEEAFGREMLYLEGSKRMLGESVEEHKARIRLYSDIAAAHGLHPIHKDTAELQELEYAQSVENQWKVEDETDSLPEQSSALEEVTDADDVDGIEPSEYRLAYEEDREDDTVLRAHPFTTEGRFATSPSTIFLPNDTLVDPIQSMLWQYANVHLVQAAEKTFGGPALPDSTATPRIKAHLRQKTIALEASQPKMTPMDAHMYMAAIVPGAYATITGIVVEVRKRLGTPWIEGLLNRPGGPRVLDAGAAGAGVLAWRDIVSAEWARLYPEGTSESTNPVPFGKATVVIGSSELQKRVSGLLGDTTFLPRLPDFLPERDLRPTKEGEVPSRKQYDVIIAPYTLWPLREDYMRKALVQNLWSLLNPNGGVLIVIEKGVPRGFELVAGARNTLLKYHISSPESSQYENELQSQAGDRYTQKEDGMIIAPCTNHNTCPMYKIPGASIGRKDHCHFEQRFIRPPFLQRLIGARSHNHEDVRFSYLAVQRGVDKRKTDGIVQNEAATEAALAGYGHEEVTVDENGVEEVQQDATKPHMLSLPRILLPPLKRHRQVTIDLCTPHGTWERWITPKSFGKQAYRDARKSSWGDLWALGAKTRVIRDARAGAPGKGKKPKRVIEVGVGDDESQDTLRGLRRGDRHKKRSKDGRRVKDLRTISEDDL